VEGNGFQALPSSDGVTRIQFQDYIGTVYPELGRFSRPGEAMDTPCDYDVSYEARFVSANYKRPSLGLGLVDARGWDKTRSGVALMGAESSDWRTVKGQYKTLSDTKGVYILGRFFSPSEVVSGTLEIRNIEVKATTQPLFPAYSLLTATASVSEDGKTMYLMVFNKSDSKEISTDIKLPGYHAASAKRWEVNGPSLGATEGVKEVVTGAPLFLHGSAVRHTFPPHSMTAIELYR
jgi:alpha-N-arabinofuranosidase